MRRLAISGALVLVACGRPAARPAAPPTEAPKVVGGPLEARPLLGDIPQRASRFGAGPVAIVASSPMAEGERVGAFVEIPKEACLLAYARSSASLEDIDLAAFAEEGNPVAVDEGPDPKPTVMICPPHPDRVYVAAHAAAGEGLCVIAAQLVPRAAAETVGRAVNAHGSSPKSPETWPGLDTQVRLHRSAIGGTWEEQRRVAVAVDARAVSTVGFTIDEQGCADALVVPDEDVAVIDVDVFDNDGRLVARAKDTLPARSITVCSQTAVAGSMQIRPHVGRGLVAVVIAKAKGDAKEMMSSMLARPEVAWVSSGVPMEQAKQNRERALGKLGYGHATSTQNGTLQLGRRVTLPIDLDPAACTRVDVVAGAPLALVDAAVWDPNGNLLGTGDGADSATIFACGKGKARLDLGTRGRPGPFVVTTHAERWKDASFAAHPLAAGRMLSRFAPLFEGAPGRVKSTTLDAAKRYAQEAQLPAGACLRVAAGVEGEGTGLELRIFDATTNEELDRAAGQTSASVRACAGNATINVRTEARATAGKLDAVIGERLR
jgi:hypothetical protein